VVRSEDEQRVADALASLEGHGGAETVDETSADLPVPPATNGVALTVTVRASSVCTIIPLEACVSRLQIRALATLKILSD
jgi:hypothetical protein